MANKKVIFWQKTTVLKKGDGERKTEFELMACEAEVIGEGSVRCQFCNELEQGHGKRGRNHAFTPNKDRGLKLSVTYAGNPGMGQTVELDNVQQGKEANCYTEVK